MTDFLASLFGIAFTLGPFFVAIVLGFLLPLIVVGLSSVSSKWPDHLKLTVIFAAILIGSTLAVAFSGRVLVSQETLAMHPNLMASASLDQGNVWFSRIAHLVLLSVSIAEIFLWFLGKRYMGKQQFSIWIAAMAYYVLSVPVSGVLGHYRGFDINLIYAPIVFTAVALLVSTDFKKTLISMRWLLLIPLLGSLIAIWVAPNLVLETGYKSLIPGFSIRLAGLTPHANSLGLIAVIAMFLELSKFVHKKPNLIFLLISIANLVLAQSKTAWIIAIIGFAILSLNALIGYPHNKRYAYILPILTGVCFLASIAILLVFTKVDVLQSFLEANQTGLTSFTGRTKIWEITLNEFFKNPLYGYGLSIWDQLYRYQHGMMHVGQAHNQYIQILGQAGLLGVISLSFYIIQLVRKGCQKWSDTYGFSLLIVIVLLVRGFSESPMRMMGILDFDSFVHLLVFATIASVAIRTLKKE